jgi:homoserine kinase
MDSVSVIVPCSTSNLGSGFDTLGLALNLHTRVTLNRAKGNGVQLQAMGIPIPKGADELCAKAWETFFEASAIPPFGVEVSVNGDVPVARGLGFSSTVRAGIVAGLNELAGTKLSRDELVELVTRLEGHPDNASPAVLGGFTVSGMVDGKARCLRFDVDPGLKAVTLIPKFHVRTEAARELIPKQFTKADAAHALNRSALIAAAFAAKNYEALRGVFDDRFHQPHRLNLVPRLDRVIAAGVAAGAIGGFLSGSGSSIICLTLKNSQQAGEAMQSELSASDVKVLSPENKGLTVENDK